ncbi:hypothetical protein [Burkholderia singularis]|uniref:Large exoproteins involved in heme utilization or adhesion n=1 Tax=Burkholderia singularis TaxID=1503053 RepID=A0A238GY86_9BURK|nr:hypothetical protein [Burkholderia singularis]SMF97946.1 Large exoproteins involved in heme utilization or adhesion [Burkholderia singularis]
MISGLGGGSALAGAAGAGLSTALAGKLNSVADSIAGATGDTNAGLTAGNILSRARDECGCAGWREFGGVCGGNRDQSSGQGKGGTGRERIDRFKDKLIEATVDYIKLRQVGFKFVITPGK